MNNFVHCSGQQLFSLLVMGKTSPIWQFYNVNSLDSKYAECKLCNVLISRGGDSIKTFGTTALIAHIRVHHKKQYKLITDEACAGGNKMT